MLETLTAPAPDKIIALIGLFAADPRAGKVDLGIGVYKDAEGRTPIDVLRATLPAGTVSGAPKVRAMEIIDELEVSRRGPYAGVVGYLDFSGNIDTAIAIRTMVVQTEPTDGVRRAAVQAGAGVVADSDADDEELETRNKARALLVAIPAAEHMTRQRREASGQDR